MSDYMKERTRLLNKDKAEFIGEDIELNDKESELNNKIIQLKSNELESCYKNSIEFLPSQHFFKSRKKIENSDIFKIIKDLPKGHSLHIHLLAAASVDFLIKNITYKENCYGKFIDNKYKIKFMKPDEAITENWTSLKDLRNKDANFDAFLEKQFSLIVENPMDSYTSIELVWSKFKKIFSAVYDMLAYKPAFEEYYYQCLKELYEDNVMYVEFRATPMPLYDLEGTTYKTEDFFELMLSVEENFKKKHTDFIGAKYIHSTYRGVSTDDLKKDLTEILKMKKRFPELIVGLDFVGFEEEGHSLVDFQPELNDLKDNFNFFFHAGETNWFGHTDNNLVDAILMKSKRIGHGFALSKHPVLMEELLKQDIAIELCPISNQVLRLNDDPRNHPVITLFSKGYPVVLCNDDPSVWGASGLSYDWYIAFMAMTPKTIGLKFLKKLALNSIKYSAIEDREKAMESWKKRWDDFVSRTLDKIDI